MKKYFRFIKIEHTLFSLPIIFAGAVLALKMPGNTTVTLSIWKIFLILVAATCARAAGFGFNRILDAPFDAQNSRTAKREVPSGIISAQNAWIFTWICALIFVVSAFLISPLCFYFSPVPILLFYLYPYFKRFTFWTHLGLGIAWGSAPLGGWLAAKEVWAGPFLPVILLAGFCIFWVAGFDILYSLLDEDFDRKTGLHSMPSRLGKSYALRASQVFHAAGILFLAFLVSNYLPQFRAYVILLAITGGLTISHVKVLQAKTLTPQIIDFAFFKVNAIIGFLVLLLVL